MKIKDCNTYWVKIYIAGDIEQIKNIAQDYCFKIGQCVTITPTTYVYTGGREEGAEIGFINYPRFPEKEEIIWDQAMELTSKLINETFQLSATVMTPNITSFISRKDEIKR